MFKPNLRLIKTFRMGMSYAARQLTDLEIGSGQVFFVMELGLVDWMNLSDLSRAVGVDNAYTTRTINRLDALGYVDKAQDETDRRAFRISLTPKGRKVAERVNEVLKRWVATITVGVSPEDIATVNRVFDKFYQNSMNGLREGLP